MNGRKLALGIKVTDLQGNRVGFLRALGRNLAKIISAIISLSASSWPALPHGSRRCTT